MDSSKSSSKTDVPPFLNKLKIILAAEVSASVAFILCALRQEKKELRGAVWKMEKQSHSNLNLLK